MRKSRWIAVLDHEPANDEMVTLREEIVGLGWTGRSILARIYNPRPTTRMPQVVVCICSHARMLHDDTGHCTLCGCQGFRAE